MLDTLQKMSGVTHKSFTDSKTVTVDKERVWMQNEGKASYTMTTKEVPVISYNDMAFISERNSIVFRAGDSPIWNRNETILPMSWRLFKNTIVHAGHDYTLQTIPTLSSALDFDVRKNQPDFNQMLNKRMEQACVAEDAKKAYQDAYGYSDYEMEQLDPDVKSDEIMDVINTYVRQKKAQENNINVDDFDDLDDDDLYDAFTDDDVEENTEQLEATAAIQQADEEAKRRIYADHMLSRDDLISKTNGIDHGYDRDIIKIYKELKSDMWRDTEYFTTKNGSLYSADGRVPYIIVNTQSENLQNLNDKIKDSSARVYADNQLTQEDIKQLGSFEVTDEFYRFLVGLPSWSFAKGRFDSAMGRLLRSE